MPRALTHRKPATKKGPNRDPAKRRASEKRYRDKNRDKIRAIAKKHYESHRHEILEAERLKYAQTRKSKRVLLTADERLDRRRRTHRLARRKRAGIVDAHDGTKSGPCEICGSVVDKLHLDHDHTTGIARGWLCGNCNRAIGLFKDNELSLRRAIAYLRKSNAKEEESRDAAVQGTLFGSGLRPQAKGGT